MHKQFFLIFLGLFLTGGWTMAQSFTIEGKIEGVNGGKAELQTREAGKIVVKYSTVIAEDGTFVLKGTVDEPDTYLLKIGDLRGGIGIFLDNSAIRLIAQSGNLQGAEIKGSSTQDDLAGYNRITKAQAEQFRPMYAAFNEANQANDTVEMNKIKARMGELGIRQTEEKMAYIHTIIKSPVASYLLNQMINSIEDPLILEKLMNDFDPALAGYKYVKTLKGSLAKMKITAVGSIAPDFTQNDPDGHPVKLSDFRGKYVLVDFWAAWCGPCRAENPNVLAMFNKYKNKNFTVLGVSLDRDKTAWLKAIKDDKLTWTQVSDTKYWDNEVARMYGIQAIPANILLDETGKIIGRNLRGDKLETALAKFVK